ncbi:hypothetical protein BURMUCGD2M_0752 [Burkholderia multivorans CGD2M]|uniref:Uncharacterized protein n=1 Tax=Burkholderia multivorans CGD2 TaxID=513052 RepID=B9BU05_9BURK|nr:hypothetical protein BURMUCGD2_0663 [Burkholderia multivorans CGD2]EEE12655.1 hypothetical protein BURMUCGD2M_0752 [Burkholderia multivorans CGD2M]
MFCVARIRDAALPSNVNFKRRTFDCKFPFQKFFLRRTGRRVAGR